MVKRKMPKEKRLLIAFDMDGTLTKSVSWEDVHKAFGTLECAKEHRRLYESGKINYEEWMKKDVSLWLGKDYSIAKKVLLFYEFIEGLEQFCRFFKEKSILAIISAGLEERARDIASKLCFDFVVSNGLVVKNGKITGYKCMVTPGNKGKLLQALIEKYSPQCVIAIGDTEFDKSMFRFANIAVSIGNHIDCADIHVNNFIELLSKLTAKL